MTLVSKAQKNEIEGIHKEFNNKDNDKASRLGQENLKSNGCVKRWASPGMDQPLAHRQPSILSGKNTGSFDRHYNRRKYEDGGNTSDFSDTHNLQYSSVLSESRCKSHGCNFLKHIFLMFLNVCSSIGGLFGFESMRICILCNRKRW